MLGRRHAAVSHYCSSLTTSAISAGRVKGQTTMQLSGSKPVTQAPSDRSSRQPWEKPSLTKLPPLTELTLQTGGAIPGGGTPPGGSTVF